MCTHTYKQIQTPAPNPYIPAIYKVWGGLSGRILHPSHTPHQTAYLKPYKSLDFDNNLSEVH